MKSSTLFTLFLASMYCFLRLTLWPLTPILWKTLYICLIYLSLITWNASYHMHVKLHDTIYFYTEDWPLCKMVVCDAGSTLLVLQTWLFTKVKVMYCCIWYAYSVVVGMKGSICLVVVVISATIHNASGSVSCNIKKEVQPLREVVSSLLWKRSGKTFMKLLIPWPLRMEATDSALVFVFCASIHVRENGLLVSVWCFESHTCFLIQLLAQKGIWCQVPERCLMSQYCLTRNLIEMLLKTAGSECLDFFSTTAHQN